MVDLDALKARFMAKVEPIPFSGCWLWTATLNEIDGYGRFYVNEQRRHGKAHRLSWEFFKGPIPDGKMVCHSCDIRCCVNPNHLWLGTNTDNMRDAGQKGRLGQRWFGKTHCANGHAFDAENTRYDFRGYRSCRACDRNRKRALAAYDAATGAQT